jgi:hypothetical protein
MEASIETANGTLIPWKEFRSMIVADHLPTNLSNFLQLDVYTVSLRFEWLDHPPQNSWDGGPDPPYRPGFYIRCHDSYAIYSPLQLSGYVDPHDKGFTSSSWECLVLGQLAYYCWVKGENHSISDIKFTDLCVVVIKRQPNGNAAERLGFVSLGHRVWSDECERIRLKTPKKELPIFLRPLNLQKKRTRIRLG